jgi:hypothetical protein
MNNMAEWPHTPKPVTTEELMELLEPVGNLTALDVSGLSVEIPESKSPMKYAVDYKLVDSDGLIIEDTDYFITSDQAWDRARELYKLSDLEGYITFRQL